MKMFKTKIQNCMPLEELAGLFQGKLTTLQQCLQLRDCKGDSAIETLTASIEHGVSDLEVVLTLMRAEVTQRKKALIVVQEMKQEKMQLQEQIDHILKNLPDRLPKKVKTEESKNTTPVVGQAPANVTSAAAVTGSAPPPKTNSAAKKSKIHLIEYLTVNEFKTVPNYMKGRLTYDKANTAVDDFNKAMTGKYTLLTTKRAAQTDYIRKKIVAYKELENKNTKGVQFIDEKDLKDFSNWKMDKGCLSLITMFRHCGRIREIRGGGITRFAVC